MKPPLFISLFKFAATKNRMIFSNTPRFIAVLIVKTVYIVSIISLFLHIVNRYCLKIWAYVTCMVT